MILTIEVTDADIDEGVSACDKCPVARAVTRALHAAGLDALHYAVYEPYFGGLDVYRTHHAVAHVPQTDIPAAAYCLATSFDEWASSGRGEADDWDDDDYCHRPSPVTFAIHINMEVTP